MLVLSGPAGSGKTATLRVLARELEFGITEFKTDQTEGSLISQFGAFLSRSGATLGFSASTAGSMGPPKLKRPKKPPAPKRSVILVEDLPNIFTSSHTRTSFRSALTAFASSARTSDMRTPLVVIVSEAIAKGSVEAEQVRRSPPKPLTSQSHGAISNDWQDNVTSRTIVPLEVLKGGRCTEIRFNPVAKTLLKKALNATLDRAVSTSQRPSAATLDLVIASANGDIRAATNCLQFVVQDPTTLVAPSSTKGKKAKASKKSTAKDARMCVCTVRLG